MIQRRRLGRERWWEITKTMGDVLTSKNSTRKPPSSQYPSPPIYLVHQHFLPYGLEATSWIHDVHGVSIEEEKGKGGCFLPNLFVTLSNNKCQANYVKRALSGRQAKTILFHFYFFIFPIALFIFIPIIFPPINFSFYSITHPPIRIFAPVPLTLCLSHTISTFTPHIFILFSPHYSSTQCHLHLYSSNYSHPFLIFQPNYSFVHPYLHLSTHTTSIGVWPILPTLHHSTTRTSPSPPSFSPSFVHTWVSLLSLLPFLLHVWGVVVGLGFSCYSGDVYNLYVLWFNWILIFL